MNFNGYQTGGFYDELFEADGVPRRGTVLLKECIELLPDGDLLRRQALPLRMSSC